MLQIPRSRSCDNQGKGSPAKRCRGGFTLVELLVVVAIIGLLIALLLPAVQASREAARRTQCKNHLKQIGLAFQNHHEQHGFFPTGGWHWKFPPTYINDNPVVGEDQKAGWAFQILPFIEKENVWRSDVLTALKAPIEIYFCPTRRAPQVFFKTVEYLPPIPGIIGRSMCDYAASNKNKTGIVIRFKPRKFKDILDGTSQTLMVGEKRMNLWFLGQPQRDDNEGYTAGWNSDTVRNTDRPPAADFSENDDAEDGDNHFGSSHPLGFNAVFADGSVHTISYVIDRNLFEHLGTIAGNEIILDEF